MWLVFELCLAFAFHDTAHTCQSVACDDVTSCPDGTACAPGGSHCRRQCAWDEDCTETQLCVEGESADLLCWTISCESTEGCPENAVCGDAGLCERAGEYKVLGGV